MNGAESLIMTASASGMEVCFANFGTTEVSLVAALDSMPGIRAVPALFEGVCTGAADGYAAHDRQTRDGSSAFRFGVVKWTGQSSQCEAGSNTRSHGCGRARDMAPSLGFSGGH